MEKILVGLDGSQNSFKALKEAIGLSLFYNAELHTVSVEKEPLPPGPARPIEKEKQPKDSGFHPYIEKARQMAAEQSCLIEPHVLVGHEVRAILDFIEDNQIDYLVVGFVGVSAVYERMMGGTSSSLVRLAPCDVLVVK